MIYPTTAAEPRGLVLWHPGGPGLKPPPYEVRNRGLPKAFSDHHILYLAEPWVTTSFTADCLDAVADAAQRECDLESLTWADGEVREAVHAAEQETGSKLAGVYATSYGATAVGRVATKYSQEGVWIILENPAPPAGTGLQQLLKSRAQAVRGLIARWTPCASECERERLALLREWERTGLSQITAAEMALGLTAAAVDPGANAKFLDGFVKDLDRGAQPSAEDQRALRRAASRFRLRRSGGQALPALVGLWAGTCPAFGGIEQQASPPSTIEDALAVVYDACGQNLPRIEQPVSSSRRVLLVHGAADAVVPPDIQRLWHEKFPGARKVTIKGSGHFRDSRAVGRTIALWLKGQGS